jgi:hypothetical protein
MTDPRLNAVECFYDFHPICSRPASLPDLIE